MVIGCWIRRVQRLALAGLANLRVGTIGHAGSDAYGPSWRHGGVWRFDARVHTRFTLLAQSLSVPRAVRVLGGEFSQTIMAGTRIHAGRRCGLPRVS